MSILRKLAGPVLLTVVGLLVATVLVGRHLGWESMVVTTGSMSPTYPAGSLILSHPADGSEQVGDVIVFPHPEAPGVRVTHRITAVVTDPQPGYRTQGDANEAEDRWIVPTHEVIGVVPTGVPGLGLALTRFRTGPGPWVLATAILAFEAVRQFRHRDEDDQDASPSTAVALVLPVALLASSTGVVRTTIAAFSDTVAFSYTIEEHHSCSASDGQEQTAGATTGEDSHSPGEPPTAQEDGEAAGATPEGQQSDCGEAGPESGVQAGEESNSTSTAPSASPSGGDGPTAPEQSGTPEADQGPGPGEPSDDPTSGHEATEPQPQPSGQSTPSGSEAEEVPETEETAGEADATPGPTGPREDPASDEPSEGSTSAEASGAPEHTGEPTSTSSGEPETPDDSPGERPEEPSADEGDAAPSDRPAHDHGPGQDPEQAPDA